MPIHAVALQPADLNFERFASRALAVFGTHCRTAGQERRHLPDDLCDKLLRDIGLYRDRTDEPQLPPMPSWRVEL